MSIVVNNLYSYDVRDGIGHSYIINNTVYDAIDLVREKTSIDEILSDARLLNSFNVDSNGSKIVIISTTADDMIYQQLQNGQFVELTDRANFSNDRLLNISILEVPLPNGVEINSWFQRLPLRDIGGSIIQRLQILLRNRLLNEDDYDEILNILNTQNHSNIQPSVNLGTQLGVENNLKDLSYETLTKQLYGIPVKLPEYLIINGLRINFITFQQIGQMLSQTQIERYILDPLVQPWSGTALLYNFRLHLLIVF